MDSALTAMTRLQDQLVEQLRRAAGLLDASRAGLKAEIIEACDLIDYPTYRVAVFGPFNYGKSTLLNALLGEKTLPMDLVPTTGAAITVKYGLEPLTRILHVDGSVTEEAGTSRLQDYAVLDEQRQMRADVAAVDVYCPHPLLQLGLELIDLPGTDDQQAQNDLVQQQLLSADLVIQLLDGRKLMTLAERENLRDWLLDKGINTVIFVVNFLNLMESADRQQVALRLRFLAESFRAQLPDGVSNLYPVDALPALRARLKGDMAAATQTGLPALETALQTIGHQMVKGRPPEQTLPRLKVIADATTEALKEQIDALSVIETNPVDIERLALRKKAQPLIKAGFEQSVEKLRSWLEPKNLQAYYRLGLAEALEAGTTQAWLLEYLEPTWCDRTKPIIDWVHQASDMFERDCPPDLHMTFSIEGHQHTETAETKSVEDTPNQKARNPSVAPVAVATGLGWILGGPLGAAVLGGTSHLLTNSGKRVTPESTTNEKYIDFPQQADIYLERFSNEAQLLLTQYENAGKTVIQMPFSAPEPSISSRKSAELNLLSTTLKELKELISDISLGTQV
ncbi:MAG: dynamin family protein [Cyanobacteria bacterium P01_F01_bin.3]